MRYNFFLLLCIVIIDSFAQKVNFDETNTKVFNEICKTNNITNVVYSPISANASLVLLMNSVDDVSVQNMKSVLGLNGYSIQEINHYFSEAMNSVECKGSYYNASICKSAWLQNGYSFKNYEIDSLSNLYDVQYSNVDFGAQKGIKSINDWVDEKTHGMIKSIYDQPQEGKIVELINTVYFKDAWNYPFDSSLTSREKFFNADGKAYWVDMMHNQQICHYKEYEDYYVANLCFGFLADNMTGLVRNSCFSLKVILPKESNSLTSLNPEDIKKMSEFEKQGELVELSVQMPKFSFESDKMNLGAILDKSFCCNIFSGEVKFSKICNCDENISLNICQKTSFVIDEYGAEAAAFTNGGGSTGVAPDYKKVELILNRPFFFVVQEDTSKEILFMGRISNMSDSDFSTIRNVKDNSCDDNIYDVLGRKIKNIVASGLYIVNSEKRFIRK